MKYIIIPYIALGFVLSSIVGVVYNCEGTEMFPEYTGSPFVFKQKSLGSSMTYYYSISGLLLNMLVWSLIILLFRKLIIGLINKSAKKHTFLLIYKGLIVSLIVLSTWFVFINYMMMGSGFKKGQNYWYMNLDKESRDWGMDCQGELVIFNQ